MKLLFSISFLACVLFSCSRERSRMSASDLKALSQSVLSKEEYKSWFESEENPQRRSQQIGNKTYRLVHLPVTLLALREVGSDANENERKAAEEHYSDLEYFQLEIIGDKNNGELLKENIANASEYDRRVNYCAFGMENDIKMVSDNLDSIPCALFHFERSFDVAPVASFMLAFDKRQIDSAKELTLVFDDNLFGNGVMKFSLSKDELLASPQMK